MAFGRWTGTVQDANGNAVAGALVEVRREGTDTLASLFADRDGSASLANPFTATEATIFFHAVGGSYRVTATVGSFVQTWRYVAVGTAGELDAEALQDQIDDGLSTALRINDELTPEQQAEFRAIINAEEVGGGGGASASVEFDNRVLGLKYAELAGRAYFAGPDGSAIHDSFQTLTYVDTTLSVNEDTAVAGVISNTAPAVTEIIADMTSNTAPSPFVASAKTTSSYSGGGLAWNAFDRNNATGWLNSGGAADFPTWLKIDLGAQTQVGSFTIRSRDTASVTFNGFPTDFQLQGSNDNTNFTTVYTASGLNWVNAETKTFELVSSATYRYWRLWITDASTDPVLIAEWQLFPPSAGNNMTLVSKGIAAAEVPNSIRCAVIARSSGVFNTDIVFRLSRDDGANWVVAPLAEMFEQDDGFVVFDTGDVDVTGLPSGSTIRWKLDSLNSVSVDVDGVAMWCNE